eukprot:158399-Prymnesium_polylepis.1
MVCSAVTCGKLGAAVEGGQLSGGQRRLGAPWRLAPPAQRSMLKEEAKACIIHVEVDELDDEELVTPKERLRRVLKRAARFASLNWWCICCCRALNFPLRQMIALAFFESMTVMGIAIYTCTSAYSVDSNPSRGVFYPAIMM